MFGVRISPPKQPMSEKPRSSATMTRKLGLLGVVEGILHSEDYCDVFLDCKVDVTRGVSLDEGLSLDDRQDFNAE